MNLRRLNIAVIALLVLFLPVAHYYPYATWWGYGLIILIQLSILVYACINISSGYFMPVLCGGNTKDKVVALTFDDGPSANYSAQVLDSLAASNVKAAFFCIGKNVPGNEEIVKRIVDDGHLIGNHSYSHAFWFDMFGSSKMLTDMRQCDNAIADAVGFRPSIFRPPYGVMNPNLAQAIKKGRYTPIGWSIRSLDTTIKDKQKLLSRISRRLQPGSIILLHDSMAITASVLTDLIEIIQREGYKIVRLDELLHIKPYV